MGPGGLSVPIADRTELLMFPRLATYSQIVARLQWDPEAIDLGADARAWTRIPDERRRRLTTLLAGFRVAEDAVAEHLTPFADVAEHVDTMMMWIFFLQRRDEDRHARFFDRVAAEVLSLPGDTPEQRRAAAGDQVPSGLLELFETRLPGWPPSWRPAAPSCSTASPSTTWCWKGPSSRLGSGRCWRTSRMTSCPGCAKA